ncbi:MAG TPA: hypothetical protein VGN18_10595 [Jatrophihabitans sp.]|jgi:hypothetical protein|uniref:hypothetical protein n=1 Tax=Jatrophihabitans sp. TaxID=1932789 RepID=UPI002E0522A5|nr:hypothetical protein [Jatrophihabitans sp.]
MRKGLTAVLAIGALTGGVATGAAPAAASERHDTTSLAVHATGGAVTLSRHSVHAGRIRITVDTTSPNGSNVLVFRPARGVSLATVLADFAEEFSPDPATDAKGTRDLTRDARFYGGGDVVPGTPVTVTENLTRATYYVADLAAPPGPNGPQLQTLVVRGENEESSDWPGRGAATVRLTSNDRFLVTGRLHARGSVVVANVSDTLHFMDLQPVKPGTTDAQIQAYFASGAQGQPPFAVNGPTAGMDVQSPGRRAVLSYSLPKGTYVLLCFVADDMTGMPHALMGMHKVVVLT